MNNTLNFTPLKQKPTLSEVFNYLKGHSKASYYSIITIVIVNVLTIIPLIILVFHQSIDGIVILAFFVLILDIIALSLVLSAQKKMVYLNFAKSNNFTVTFNTQPVMDSGVIFSQGRERMYEIKFASPTQTYGFEEIGNYTYITGSGKNQQTRSYGVVKIKLPRRLPHMLLDSRSNNFLGMSNLPISFSKDQKISLEGDFNKYFTLYAPSEYQVDARYVFTPDVMQMMINAASQYDIEIIDDTLYVYSHSIFDFDKPTVFLQTIELAQKINGEVSEQTDYYKDDRVESREANVIANEGQRLKRSTHPATIVSVIVFIVILVVKLVM